MNKHLKEVASLGVFISFIFVSTIVFAQQSPLHNISSEKMDVYTSPNGEYQAVTVLSDEENTVTYVIDSNGKEVVAPHTGSFVSWSPDNTKVLVFLSNSQSLNGRRIYYLGIDGTYKDSGLPSGTISADISPKDGGIVYSQTRNGSDRSNIYLMDSEGKKTLVTEGEDDIYAWVRWSPEGDKIAYMQSDLRLSPGSQSVWISNAAGSNKEKVSNISWDYPAVWSPDGKNIAFSNAGDIWEYDSNSKLLSNLTSLLINKGQVDHPEYSKDGKTLTYVSKTSSARDIKTINSLSQPIQKNDEPVNQELPVESGQ